MIKLIVLIIAFIILFLLFVTIVIFAFIKKTKRLFILSIISFVILLSTGIYTLYLGLQKGKEKTIQIAKNIFPPFDSGTPDTEANKKNFRDFIKVDITSDVKNIYCFDDAIGQDADYMFAFSCDSLTANKIIERHELKKDSVIGNNPDNMQHDFFWWDKKRINKLQSYSWDSDYERKNLHKLFWFDEKNEKAYYFEYDL
ncbi:SUR7/PalI family protein [Frigoriflavimonas asaccharolytica]|uniref:Energy-coupling factor transporter transmembrane protein EcfT n=1 Tax=Frigoriflavimonas asaccharolytica TaxID=2735899 RepID=A0A8J8G4D5_9FLAO|nr:SUR7/PalI family protein [Frigoriflavimonas asaccharolytica]NRS91091.1 energy-coupling factor transporter transmembrane protein EcfT [Frigoriflavimonas asaccharolytica]